MSRICKTLACVLAVVLVSSVAWGNNNIIPKYHMRTGPTRVDARDYTAPTQPTARSYGSPVRMGAITVSPGTQMGDTWYDQQHNSTTGRQVDEFGGKVQAAWMRGTGPSTANRTIRWNQVAVTTPGIEDFALSNGGTLRRIRLGAVLEPGGKSFENAVRPGFPNFNNQPNGKGVVAYHDAPEPPQDPLTQYWESQLDQSAGNGVFGSASTSPNPPGDQYQGDASAIWPKTAISECGGEYIHHAIGTWSGASNEVWYWRGVINTATGTISWASMPLARPRLIDSVSVGVSADITARGNNVAIVLGKTVSNTTNADVVYYRSTNCGIDWDPSSPAAKGIKITNFAADDPEGFWTETACVFDESDNLHVLYNTAPGSGLYYPVNLYHWDEASNNSRLITSAGWVNSCRNGTEKPGTNNGAGGGRLAIADIGISVKPAGLGPGAGIAPEMLYAVWNQYGPTNNDCASLNANGDPGGLVNADVWGSASTNGGSTWDRPRNMTGTPSPNCVPGDCFAELSLTVAPLADSGLYLSWVQDTHPGWAVNSAGTWTLSPYMVLAAEARLASLEPVIAVSPSKIIELNASPTGGIKETKFQVISVGNANLTYTINVTNDEGGASHLGLNGGGGTYSNTIIAGSAPDLITVQYDCIGLDDTTEYNWRLEITSNDPQNDPGEGGQPIDVTLEVFSASTWFACVDSLITTGLHQMSISSCLEMGKNGVDGTGFVTPEEAMYTGSPVITRKLAVADPDTLIAYHNAFQNLGERVRALNKSFRAQSSLYINRDTAVVSGDSTFLNTQVAKGEVSSTDSTIGMDYEVLFFHNPLLQDGALYKFKMFNRTSSTINGLTYGAIADLDVGDNAGNNDGRGDDTKGWIGGVGGRDTAGLFIPSTDYFSLFYLPPPGGCNKDGAAGAQVLSNGNYVQPDNAYNTDSLYTLFNQVGSLGTWGLDIREDTGQTSDDISVMLVNAHGQSLAPTDTIEWGYGLAMSDVGIADMEATIDALRFAGNSSCVLGCPIELSGDVNLSASITAADIIYLVGFVFKGGPPPQPCVASGDVNCSNTVTAADIIYLVGFVFKGGPAPCDACTSSLASEC